MTSFKHFKGETSGLRIYFSCEGREKELSYLTKRAIRIAIAETLIYEKFSLDAEVSVVICDNEYIHALNKEFRNIDRPTDVLSFPLIEADEGVPNDGLATPLGDIVISAERAEEQAIEIGHDTLREIQFLCVHSTLHLLGYDHERSPEDEEEMCEKQRMIMTIVEKKTNGEL